MLRKKREGAFQETLAAIKVALDSDESDSVKVQAIRTALKTSAAGFIPYIPPPEPEVVEPEKPLSPIEQAALIAELERLHQENEALKNGSNGSIPPSINSELDPLF